tara:strand:- start:446 stop:808 length:363 start_codon:yes stop_codon:yes gene_type:complete
MHTLQSNNDITAVELSSKNIIVATTKVKQTKRAYRLWIEGTKLTKSGFNSNSLYDITYLNDRIVLTLSDTGSRHVTGSNRNGKDRPIIDLHCIEVGNIFNANDTVKVYYADSTIVFKRGR